MTHDTQRVQRRLFIGAVFRSLGLGNYALELSQAEIRILGKGETLIPYVQLASPPALTTYLGFTVITLAQKNGERHKVAGLPRKAARRFIAGVQEDYNRVMTQQFELLWPEIHALSAAMQDLAHPRHYPAACLLAHLVVKAENLLETLPSIDSEGLLTADQHSQLKTVLNFQKDLKQKREAAINIFIENERAAMQAFFDRIETNPLTPEQRLAVITDEDATLVLAGAGSGKTSVIVAKAAYLIERGIRQPHEILLMAFGRDAAAEMARRIEDRSGARVDALTFHALGNRIIRAVEGRAAALANHASDEVKFRALLRELLTTEAVNNPRLGRLLLQWFSEFYWPYKSEWDFESQDQYYQWVESHELRALSGDRVKSFEELQIANWLYCQGITFEYEPVYEGTLPADARGAYKPDFRLTESGVYIEHFGVRKARNPDGWSTRLTTAPYIDRERYLHDMSWKRAVHRDNGTILIETYSYEKVEGRLLKSLEDKLKPFVELKPLPEKQVFETLSEMGLVDAFTQTLLTFLRHFKSSGASIEACRSRAEMDTDRERSLAFMMIFEPLLEAYQEHLGDQIDFEDMINRAAAYVETGRYPSPYLHLLVDEFQDISLGRARLLRALKAQHHEARIFAVGDDWQSIFRFAGSEIQIMRHFGETFGGRLGSEEGIHRTVDLGRTFRSVDKIALPARLFVLKNPAQIEKRVITATTTESPSIKVVYYKRTQETHALQKVLRERSQQISEEASVLLLGRYNYLKPDNMDELALEFPKLSLRFMTVHGSKGLEADHVVILNASAGKMGFPSEIMDDPLLNLVLPEPENFEHAEERRLFYVALTRARWTVTILADREKPSAFVRELVKGPEYGVLYSGDQAATEHRCSACGGRLLLQKTKGGSARYFCEHRPLCDEVRPSCNICSKDRPSRSQKKAQIFVCGCRAEFPACLDCSEGWLVERKSKYGTFLGCVNFPACKGKRQT